MVRLYTRIGRLARDEAGVTSIEYALIASLVSVTIISALSTVGVSLTAAFSSVVSAFP